MYRCIKQIWSGTVAVRSVSLIKFHLDYTCTVALTHWSRVTHICVSRITNIGLDNGLSPGRRQAIIWTNVGILLIQTLGTNSSEILREIHTFSFKKMHLKIASMKWRPFCLGLNMLTNRTKPVGKQSSQIKTIRMKWVVYMNSNSQ